MAPTYTGAYCTMAASGCHVICTASATAGGSVWVYGPKPGEYYGIAAFIAKFPNSGFVCPGFCPGCVPSVPVWKPPAAPGSPPQPPAPPPPPPAAPIGGQPKETQPPQAPVEKPITQEPCAPAMAQRDDSGALGFSTSDHMMMTGGGHLTGGRVGTPPIGTTLAAWLAAGEPPLTGTPKYSRLPKVRVDGDWKTGLITVFEPGAGDGWTAFHSPDLNEFCLRGDNAHKDGKWPRSISKQAFLIHSGARSNPADGDDSDQRFGIGLPSARTYNPRSGWYMRRDSSNELSWTPTDADGVDSTVKTEVFKIRGVFYTASGRRLNALRTSGDVTLTSANDVVFITGAHTVTLPPTPLAGDRFHLVNLTAANRTIDRNGNNIDGAGANLTLPAGASVILVQDKNGGTDWRIAGAYKYPSASGSITFPIQAPDDGVANYAFDGATTPGSENAGMGFTPAEEGPSLFDIAATAQLKVSTAGVEIPNKLTVGGFIDPTGIGFSLGAARPAGATTLGNGLWVDNDAARRLRYYNGTTDYFLVQNAGATAADNEIPRFNATGIVIQGSSLLIDDAVVDATYGTLIRQRTFDNLFGQSIALALDVGAGTGSSGSVVVGAANADGVDLGRTGKTTTIKGSGRVDQMVHFTGAFAGAAGDDVAVGAVSCFRVTSGATLTGMVPAAGGTAVDGQLMVVVNATGSNITLSHDVTSAAANRLFMAGGANLTLASNNAALFRYSTADSRWRHVGEAGGGTGGGIDEGVSAGLNFWGAW